MAGIIVDTVTAQPLLTVTLERAGTDELHRRYVRADGTRCGTGDQPLGVCRVASEGTKKVRPDAQGRAVTHAGTVPSGGLALTAAAKAGDLVAVLLNH